MHTLEFTINNQILTWTNPSRAPVEQSRGYLFARFSCDEEWEGMAKVAVFQAGTHDPVTVPLDSDTVQIPPKCLIRGQLAVGLIGMDSGGTVRIVTRQMLRGIPMLPSAPVDGCPPGNVSLEAWEKVLGSIGDLNDLNTTAKTTLVVAINEAAQGGGGGGMPAVDELDALRVLMETETIDPMADENGAVYVDEAGYIYSF